MKPDVGILSKDFLKNKGRMQPIDNQFAIHRKKQEAGDVDVGILGNGMRQQQKPFDTNLHAKNTFIGRSLQSEERLPYMCPDKYLSQPRPGTWFFGNLFNQTHALFNQTDAFFFISDGYFPKCSCPSATTCGPVLCECLEYADGDILQCMDPLNQLCEGTMYIDLVPGPWSMEKCLGNKFRASAYCSMLPCFVDGGSYYECRCNKYDSYCKETKNAFDCARSKCCQAQSDDEGREACFNGGLHENYYDEDTSFSISDEGMTSRFNECSFNSDSDKSIVQCYCESFSYGICVNQGVGFPDTCEANFCCDEQTEDDARLDCFSRFRVGWAGHYFYQNRDTIQESCIASGRSSDQCRCDIHGLSKCVGSHNSEGVWFPNSGPNCDLFQCCQSQTDDNDEGRKDCLVQNEAQSSYETCVNDGNTTESCVCDRSNKLCSSGHANDRHCELSSCCEEQTDDTGRKECIGNFTSTQPSSAPSNEILSHTDTSPVSSPSTVSTLGFFTRILSCCLTLFLHLTNKQQCQGDQVLEDDTSGTPNSSNSSLLGSKKLRKALVVITVIGWLLLP